MRRAVWLSALAHGLIAAGFLAWMLLAHQLRSPVQPDVQAQVELTLGNGGQENGAPPPGAEPVAEPVKPVPPVPPVAQTPQTPPTPPVDSKPEAPAAEPKPPPPPDPDPAPVEPPPPPAPPPPVAAPPVPPPPTPPPPPPPTPAQPSPVQAPPAPPEVRLGSEASAPPAEIKDPLSFVYADPDVRNTAPEIPREAERRRETGKVLLEMQVDATGRVAQVTVLKSSGWPLLDQAAQQKLATWHFRPAFKDGAAVPSVVQQIIDFTE